MQKKLFFKCLFFCFFTASLFLTFLVFEPSTASRVPPEQTNFNSVILLGLWALTFIAIFTIYKEVDAVRVGQIFEALKTGLSSSSFVAVLLVFYPELTGQTLIVSQYLPYAAPILIITTILSSWIDIRIKKAKQEAENKQ